MNTQQKTPIIADIDFERIVAEYLEQHPDFFERHGYLLEDLKVPHASGPAVSLIERQIAILREQGRRYKKELQGLLTVARENDQLSGRIHRLTLALMDADSLDHVLMTVHDHLRNDFQVEYLRLFLLPPQNRSLAVSHECILDRDTPGLIHFEAFLATRKPRCGRLDSTKLEFLFPERAGEIRSTALIPLQTGDIVGVLAVGSRDESRFHPGMGTTFLVYLGELISRALRRYV